MKSKVFFVISFVILGGLAESGLAKLPPRSTDLDVKVAKSFRKMRTLAGYMDSANGAAQLTLMDYHNLVFETPRNYTVFVLFYNDENICRSCPRTLDAFNKIALSFWKAFVQYDEQTSERVLEVPMFFVAMDMHTEEYRQMLVELEPFRPSLYVFTPSRSSRYNQFEQAPHEYLYEPEFGRYDLNKMLSWVQEKAGFLIPIEKDQPESINSHLALIILALCGTISLFNLYRFGYLENLWEAVCNANYSFAMSIAILWLISGHMHNFIRQVPIMGSVLIYPGPHYQYAIESLIVMGIYGIILFSFIQLVEVRERQLNERLPTEEVQFYMLSGLGGIFFAFAMLQTVVHSKY